MDGAITVDSALIAIGAFAAIVLLLAGARIASKDRFTIESKEIVAAVVAVGLGLFVFGEVSEIAFGDIRLVRAVKEAAATPVGARVGEGKTEQFSAATLEFDEVVPEAKRAPDQIPRLIETKASALSFQVGSDDDVAWVVARYVNELTKAPYLRYIVFNDSNGLMVAMADARAIAERFQAGDPALTPDALTRWIEDADRERLRGLPGYIDAADALPGTLSTRDALAAFLERDSADLPVIDETGRFIGVAHRAQLMGTILMALTDSSAEE